MSEEKSDIKQDQLATVTHGGRGLPRDAWVSNTSRKRLLKRVVLAFVLFAFFLVGLHLAANLALLNSYTELFAGSYSEARSLALLSRQLADLSPTVTIATKKAIDQQVAITMASELPVNGIYSAMITNTLLGGKYQIPDQLTAEDIIRAVRQSNMRGDIGGVGIISEKLESRSISLSVNDLSELNDEIAYDKFRSLIFSLRGRIVGSGHSKTAGDINERLASILTPIREMHTKSQGILCTTKPYRCEINKIRWLVAECNYQRELSGVVDDKCLASVRRAYLEAIGYPTRNEVIFDRCKRRFGAHGCATMAAELPFYMEALVIGFGSFNGE